MLVHAVNYAVNYVINDKISQCKFRWASIKTKPQMLTVPHYVRMLTFVVPYCINGY